MIKGVAFDLEGTVIDIESVHHRAHLLSAQEAGVYLTDVPSAIRLIPHFIGGPDELVAEEIVKLSDRQVSPEWLLERKKFHYQHLLSTVDIAPRPGFLRVCKEMQDRGLLISIGSLTATSNAKVLLETSGLDKIFLTNCIVLREDVHNVKPAPDVFLETAQRMGILPSEQLVFEDSPNGIKAAVSAGSRAIGIPVYLETVDILRLAGAEQVYSNWDEVKIDEILNESKY